MMMLTVNLVVMVAVAAVSSAFWLERDMNFDKIGSKATEHILDHMVRPDAKSLVPNFGGQMPISQMPSKARELIGIFVPDFDNELRSSLNS
jgi:hypothetical protein